MTRGSRSVVETGTGTTATGSRGKGRATLCSAYASVAACAPSVNAARCSALCRLAPSALGGTCESLSLEEKSPEHGNTPGPMNCITTSGICPPPGVPEPTVTEPGWLGFWARGGGPAARCASLEGWIMA
jgi:hypothetical protein